ncbi:MAG: hypothetical protein AAF307_08380, partial [Pseudomonadota bacterium]
PGDVVLINIHSGSFASPSGNDPDFRTIHGTLIASAAGIVGYPAGTVFGGFQRFLLQRRNPTSYCFHSI